MAADLFLELEGIKGESEDKVHKGKIEIHHWSWGFSNPGSFHIGKGGGTGKASFRDITISKPVDSASPDLMSHCANGKTIMKGKIIQRKSGEKPLEFFTIELAKVVVASYETGGGDGEHPISESLTLNFAEVKVVYRQQTDKGGKGAEGVFGWDIAANAKK